MPLHLEIMSLWDAYDIIHARLQSIYLFLNFILGIEIKVGTFLYFFLAPPTQSLCWRSIGMVPYQERWQKMEKIKSKKIKCIKKRLLTRWYFQSAKLSYQKTRLWTNQGEYLKSALKQRDNPKHLIGQNFVPFWYLEFASPKEFFGILDIFEKNLCNKATLYFTGWP